MKKENILLRQFKEKGYTDLADFKERSGCPMAIESIRKAVYLGVPVTIPILLIIVKCLEFDHKQIRKILQDAGDKDYWPLIGDQEGVQLDEQETTLLEAFRKIKMKGGDKIINQLADYLELTGKAVDVDVSGETIKIRKKLKKTRKQ